MQHHELTREPIFIVRTGRSGSTLLRYILDTHESIDAPQELHLGPLAKELASVLSLLMDSVGEETQDTDHQVMSEVRSILDSMLRSKLKKRFGVINPFPQSII